MNKSYHIRELKRYKSYARYNETYIKSNKVLIRITTNSYFFSFLKIFEEFLEVPNPETTIISPKKELLLDVLDNDRILLITSNNSNIQSLETLKQENYDIKVFNAFISFDFRYCVSILPSETPSLISMIYSHHFLKHIYQDFSIQNFLLLYQ